MMRCLILAALSAWAMACPAAPADNAVPAAAGMVDVREIVADIDVDMRYAGADNFVGHSLEGYEASRCYLLRPAAQALAQVQSALRRDGYALRVWDCYRPHRAVRAMVRWAQDPHDQQRKATHYPHVDKAALLGGYIARRSGHSRGATVDLTLLDCRHGECEAVDMGTVFDYFDPLASTSSSQVTPAQHANRMKLLRAMEAGGFGNYPREWWHFTWRSIAADAPAHDFPVR